MEALLWLIPVALALGLLGLTAFVWALRSGQFEDMDGAAMRILIDEDGKAPPDLPDARQRKEAPIGGASEPVNKS